MILKALEMQGFKSFPDKTVFNFNNGITAVVGPNGSGKSNIADAVRWVLGEQSSKNLRGSKMEDVIFGGTKIRKALGYAEVTLRLDNKDRSLNCDSDEVAVTRRYYRSGESEYCLNAQVVRLRDIHELFMDTGLGRDGYSLVSQGRVADLISSKSGQRRDMLEEAAGISHYRYRRTDANRRLDQAEENMVRLRDILSELESRVGPLKIQSEKAQKFLVLSKEKKNLEIGLWLHTIENSKKRLKEQEDKLSIANAQYEDVENQLEAIRDEMDEAIEAGQSINRRIDEIRRERQEKEEQAAQKEAVVAVEKNTIEHNLNTVERLKKDVSDASDTEHSLESQIKEGESFISNIQSQIAEKKKELDSANAEILSVKAENSEFAEKLAEITQQIADINEKIAEKRIDETTAVSSIEEINARIANIDGVLTSRNEYVNSLTETVSQCSLELEELKEKAKEIANAVAGYNMRVQSKSERAGILKAEIDDKTLEIHQKTGRIHILEDMEKNMEGYAGSVKAVIKEAKGGMLRGIHGTLSQLISVDTKYAVAVETALGNAVQNIVTDNENDAKRAINFLKDSKAGRATFLPITSVNAKEFTETGLDDCYGFVDMADKLLDYDEKYSEIIKSLLGRTAVAEDLDCAITIAKKYSYRFKIVTLDGQIINAGGSMTGGSRGQNAGILNRSNEIEKLTAVLNKLESENTRLKADYKLATEELSSAQADLDGAQADLSRAQEDIIRKESEYELVQGKLDTANAALEELRREKVRSNQRITELEEAKETALKGIEELNGQANALRETLDEASQWREELENKKEELAQKEAQINLAILALQKDAQARSEAVEILRNRMESHEGRVADLNSEISAILDANAEIEEKIALLQSEAAALHKESSDASEEIQRLTQEHTDYDAKDAKLRIEERMKTAEREKISGELARLEERKTAMEKQLDDTVNKLFDEYQLTRREAEELDIVIEDYQQAQRSLQDIKNKIRSLGNVNVGAIEEYEEVSQRYEFMGAQLEDIEKSRAELDKLIKELTDKMSEQFREQFQKINTYFGETFVELFGGGKAELVLENQLDVLECNIEIKVQPPGKNVQNIDLLSGGEKGLSAIALLFAILKVSPSPFCIFDEVEAALDDVNVTRYAKYVRRMTKNTQFILITHRRGTMEEADVLYGVTMQEEGVSKLLELKTAEMAKKLGIA
ncbi:MAG: chromosome segregation protein SMC [Clostridia bacterium]|nr:chromosome segregation protein SMC [Clostridia bacterium]